jgi:hypothetical protein
MRTRLALAAACLGLWLAGCDVSDLTPGAGNGAGTGTGALAVTGSVYATPRVAEAGVGADFAVSFSVRVSLDRALVTTGSVTVTSAAGKVPLTFHDDGSCPGWSGTGTGYDEVYVLDVVTDATHKVEGVRVDGPDIHVFSQPREGASIDTSVPLVVAWDRNQRADVAALRPEPAGWIPIDDLGSYALPAGSFWSNDSGRLHTLRLARTNQVAPEGATADSSWSVTLENDVHVIDPPLPL